MIQEITTKFAHMNGHWKAYDIYNYHQYFLLTQSTPLVAKTPLTCPFAAFPPPQLTACQPVADHFRLQACFSTAHTHTHVTHTRVSLCTQVDQTRCLFLCIINSKDTPNDSDADSNLRGGYATVSRDQLSKKLLVLKNARALAGQSARNIAIENSQRAGTHWVY